MSKESEELKESVRQNWTEGVAAWRKWNKQLVTTSKSATEAIVEAIGTAKGLNVLDLASGTGEPALSLAEAVGDSGHVLATDLVPEMLDVMESHIERLQITNLTCEQADPEHLPFADASFDAVTCRFGVMFFPDVEKAMLEVHRVLKSGGKTVFVVFGPADQNPYFASTSGLARRRAKLPPPEPGGLTPFRFALEGSLARELGAAGFQNVTEEHRTVPWVFEGGAADCWQFIRELTGPAFKSIFDAIPSGEQESVVEEIIDAIEKHRVGDHIDFTARIIIATGVRGQP